MRAATSAGASTDRCSRWAGVPDDGGGAVVIWLGRLAVAIIIAGILYASLHGVFIRPPGHGRLGPLFYPSSRP